MQRALDVFVGRVARERIAERGWDPELFSLLLGASGGPRWLVLSQLDRVLFGDFLQRRTTPLSVLGTSIGSWRHACLPQAEPLAATARMEEAYIHQRYSPRPGPEEVSHVSRDILERVLGENGARQLVDSSRFVTHIGVARGRGPTARRNPLLQGMGLALAAFSNALSRKLLRHHYQRVVFCSNGDATGSGMGFNDFSTVSARLTVSNAIPALLASGSIPITMAGVRNPVGAPAGLYWDGALLDYHHDLSAYGGEKLVLFPHFHRRVIPGIFDEPFSKRHARGSILDRVVLLAPSEPFVSQLPGGKIPDISDFRRLEADDRIERWWAVVDQCQALANELTDLLSQSDPLKGTLSFADQNRSPPTG